MVTISVQYVCPEAFVKNNVLGREAVGCWYGGGMQDIPYKQMQQSAICIATGNDHWPWENVVPSSCLMRAYFFSTIRLLYLSGIRDNKSIA